MGLRFYTGLKWSQVERFSGPACVCLSGAPKRSFPVVNDIIVLDDGFAHLCKEGRWTRTIEEHIALVRRCVDGIGRIWIPWCSSKDWMCEPKVRLGTSKARARGYGDARDPIGTGLSVREHQRRTVANYIELTRRAPDLPWIPVLQGWTRLDYVKCFLLYRRAGIDLTECEIVGVGSICSRQATQEVIDIIVTLIRLGLRLHLYGVKRDCLLALAKILTDEEWARISADSAAWSMHAWKQRILMPGHHHGEKTANCANCTIYANHNTNQLHSRLEKVRSVRTLVASKFGESIASEVCAHA